MSKNLTLTDEALEQIIDKAVQKHRMSIDEESIEVVGCNISCIINYEINIRNEDKELIALKTYCNQNDINSGAVFKILKDLELIEELKPNHNILTDAGFEQLNTRDDQSKPFMTSIHGNIYINDKDERLDILLGILENHPLYKDGYNKRVKDRKIDYTYMELNQAKKLGINIIKTKEITNEKGE